MESLRGSARDRDEAQRGWPSEFQFGGACACHRNDDDPLLAVVCQPFIAIGRRRSLTVDALASARHHCKGGSVDDVREESTVPPLDRMVAFLDATKPAMSLSLFEIRSPVNSAETIEREAELTAKGDVP